MNDYYKKYIEKAIRFLKAPNEFELLEFIQYSDVRYSFPDIDVFFIRYYISALLRESNIVKCKIKSKRYPNRYVYKTKKPYCILEPAILKNYSSKFLIKEAKNILINGKKNFNGFMFIPDPYRDIVVTILNNSIMGVIDLRYNRPYYNIRFPTRFNNRSDRKIPGMTELRYFSCLIENNSNNIPNRWLNIRCMGYSTCD